EVRIEPNPIAAMPSIHFAATALLVFPVRRAGVPVAGAMVLYACLMAIALVYLGEHYVLDIVVGGTLAGLAWWITGRCFAATADTTHESDR
ncbi:MAG TPA: phosphatase PAP2 family protein, partial [Thermomicrobiales bacterium]|nr:phosphatase PAP2 family protein [Thermomicrobiales bacterium]